VPPVLRLVPLLAILGGCATAPREPALAYLSLAGSGPCTVDIDNRRYVLPGDRAALDRRMKRLAARTEGAIVAGEEALSFACWRETMAIVRRAGFPKLGLVTDAPPDPAVQTPTPDQPRPSPKRPT
jgi:hypothetical protein